MIIIDLSKWNVLSSFQMKKLKQQGVNGTMIQLTAGTGYPNQQASNQIALSNKYFGWCGAYHYYYGDVASESKEFLSYLKKYKIDKHAPIAIDVEDSSLVGNQIHDTNRFLDILMDHGYDNLYIYSMASWFWTTGKLYPSNKLKYGLWVANYGASSPNVPNTSIFQYTDNFKGFHADASVTFDSFKTGKRQVKVRTYLKDGTKFKVIAKNGLNGYRDESFKIKHGNVLARGSIVYGKIIKIGKITRLKTNIGYFSANTRYLRKIK